MYSLIPPIIYKEIRAYMDKPDEECSLVDPWYCVDFIMLLKLLCLMNVVVKFDLMVVSSNFCVLNTVHIIYSEMPNPPMHKLLHNVSVFQIILFEQIWEWFQIIQSEPFQNVDCDVTSNVSTICVVFNATLVN